MMIRVIIVVACHWSQL